MATPESDPTEQLFELLAGIYGSLTGHADPVRAVENLFDRRAEFLVPLRVEHAEVHAAMLDRYSDAFDALEFAILLCRSLEEFLDRYVPDDGDWLDVDYSIEGAADRALNELFRSGTLVAGEVLALMRAGYSTGALARWRALHETATRAEFISRAGDAEKVLEVGQRYLEHARYHRIRELQEAVERYRSVNPSLPRVIPWEESFAWADELIAKYGTMFKGDFGWAHAHLMETSDDYTTAFDRGRRGRGPQFGDLESVVRGRTGDPRRWQDLYANSHRAVHGEPHASINVGKDGTRIRLRGPREEPMWEPGEATAHRLSDLLWAFELPDHVLPYLAREASPLSRLPYAVSQLAEMAERAFTAAGHQASSR